MMIRKNQTFLFFLLLSSCFNKEALSIDLKDKSIKEILDQYTFIGDFYLKEEERSIGGFFWRYPFETPHLEFETPKDFGMQPDEMFATAGNGRAVEHLNKGRLAFMAKEYDEARKIWLSARARYGKSYPFHRRNDYFLGINFIHLAQNIDENEKNQIRLVYANAATFLSWAFVVKKEISDELLDKVTPKSLYALATIYYRYNHYTVAYQALELGLDFLRKTGRKDYFSDFHRLLAEISLKNSDYFQAAKDLDIAIRNENDPLENALSFARVGDIYYALNNFDLAEDSYSLATAIFHKLKAKHPYSLYLRGESLFWLGRFAEAKRFFWLALQNNNSKETITPIEENVLPWIYLRLADCDLALYEKLNEDKRKKEQALRYIADAKLSYFRAKNSFPKTEAARVADIRLACLELPTYLGKNIAHGRKLLFDYRKKDLPLKSIELGWFCELNSYAQDEKSQAFVDRVKEFVEEFPASSFVPRFVKPIKEIRSIELKDMLLNKDPYQAIALYETRQKTYPQLPSETKALLFSAYLDTFQTKKAAVFWPDYQKAPTSDLKTMRSIVFLSEQADLKNEDFKKQNNQLSETLKNYKFTTEADRFRSYISRILAAENGVIHLPTLYQLENYQPDNILNLCKYVHPVLSQWLKKHKTQDPKKALSSLIAMHFPALIEKDTECAESFLELESFAFAAEQKDYAQKWLERLTWPLVSIVTHSIWTSAEILAENKDFLSATKLWQFLQDKAPKDSLEKKYAELRLSQEKTESEKMWGN